MPYRGHSYQKKGEGLKSLVTSGFEFSENCPIHQTSVFFVGMFHGPALVPALPVISGARHGPRRNYMGLSVSPFAVFAAVCQILEGKNYGKL